MGVVFAAFDTQLRRKVAVKRLRESGGGAAAERRRARFLCARRSSSPRSLTPTCSPSTTSVGSTASSTSSPSWSTACRCRAGSPTPRRASAGVRSVDLYLQAGRGLSAAHRIGVVHRDVKPENILVARTGRVLIGDFGLAGLMEAGESSPDAAGASTSLTQTGSVLGTPAYMAPEQHDGKPSDALSDQFSFCVSLYESLHGRRPFPGRTAAEVATAVKTIRPALGEDGVPRAVDHVLATGLAVDPRRRHRSMDDLLSALARARRRSGRAPAGGGGARDSDRRDRRRGDCRAAPRRPAARAHAAHCAQRGDHDDDRARARRCRAVSDRRGRAGAQAGGQARRARQRRRRRGPRPPVGAPAPGGRSPAAARSRRSRARRRRQRRLPAGAQPAARGRLARGGRGPRAPPARELRDAARPL